MKTDEELIAAVVAAQDAYKQAANEAIDAGITLTVFLEGVTSCFWASPSKLDFIALRQLRDRRA